MKLFLLAGNGPGGAFPGDSIQPDMVSGSMENLNRALQTHAGHLFSLTWASYSSRK